MPTDLFVELSHTIENGRTAYPGLPEPVIADHLAREQAEAHYAPGTSFAISRIEMVANTGTYIDAPYHRYEAGVDCAGLPLESMANLPGVVVSSSEARIGPEAFAGRQLAGRAVLVRTGWSRHWQTPRYLEDYPCLTKAAGAHLVESRVALVGIDSPNVDDNGDGTRPVHTALLGAGAPIVEHLTGLESLPDHGFRFFAVPPKIRRFTSFPVRAFALLGSGGTPAAGAAET